MKNLIYFAMGILFAISLQAQTQIQIQNTFMTSIDPNNEHRSNNGNIIINTDNGFIIVGASSCYGGQVGCLDFVAVDPNGMELWTRNFENYPYGFSMAWGGLIKNVVNDYDYTALGITAKNDSIYGFLLYLNAGGDTIASVPFTNSAIGIANGSEIDGNSYIALYTSGIPYVTAQAVLQQVFADGTLGWSKTFAPTNYTNGISLGKMYDNGFVLGLSVFDFNNPDNFRADIVRTTGTGDTLWSKWLPTIDPDYAPLLQVLVQANHNIAAAWAIDTFLYVPGEGLYNQYPPTVFCLSESGEILWKHVFVARSWKTITSIRTAANGDIIGCGYNDADVSGFIFRLSATGELLWEHEYYNSYSSVNHFFLFDLVETHEGNIAATGVVMTDIGQQGAIDNDIGLLLVDANGCVEGSCEDTIYLSVANEGQAWHNLSKPRFVVSPNPVGNQTTLLYQLPPNTQNAQLALLIYDVFGRQIAKYTLPEQQQNFTFNTANLPNGIYVYTVLAKGQRIYTNKFVKQ